MDAFEEDSMEETTFIQHHSTQHPTTPLQLPALSMSTSSEAPPMRLTLSPPNPTPSALSLADSLVTAVKNLQTELATVQAKLIAAEQQLKEMPSESMLCVWECLWLQRECGCGGGGSACPSCWYEWVCPYAWCGGVNV